MAERYNVIVIMTDQQRANLFSTEGFPEAITPTLDSMTDNGIGFENAYTSTPICAPARESLLTGRFPRVTGIRTNDAIEQSRYGIDLMQWSWELGYQTALIGKNHSHLTESDVDFYRPYSHDYGPERPGKEEIDRKFNDFMAELAHGVCTEPTPFPLDCQYPVRIVDDTIDWLRSCGNQPFTLWMSLSEPHNPYQVPEPYFDMFPADKMPPVDDDEILESKSYPWRFSKELIEKHYPNRRDLIARYRSNYLGMLRLIDDQILRLLNFLDEASLSERTILVFLSDHGDFVGEYGLLRKAVPIPECLARIPMIWKGPGIEGGMLSTPIVSIVDVFPTICEALGQEIPIGVQGRSLWPILTGKPYPEREFASMFVEQSLGGLPEDETSSKDLLEQWPQILRTRTGNMSFDEVNFVNMRGSIKMVRKGPWKLVYDLFRGCELYNLSEDPREINNLIDDPRYDSITVELKEELLRWLIRTEDELPLQRWSIRRPPHNWYWE